MSDREEQIAADLGDARRELDEGLEAVRRAAAQLSRAVHCLECVRYLLTATPQERDDDARAAEESAF